MKFASLFRPFPLIAVLLGLALALVMPAPARAGYEAIEQTLTMDSGTSDTTVTIPMKNSMIREVVAFVPTLDANDVSTLTLRQSVFSDTVTPNSWTDKGFGATEDNDVIKCNTSQLSIGIDGDLVITFYAATNQAADRTFKVWILREY